MTTPTTDLYQTPRAEFEALAGKRPDLLLTDDRARSGLAFAEMDALNDAPCETARYFGVWCRHRHQPLLTLLGGPN